MTFDPYQAFVEYQFDWQYYVSENRGLRSRLRTFDQAWKHYQMIGRFQKLPCHYLRIIGKDALTQQDVRAIGTIEDAFALYRRKRCVKGDWGVNVLGFLKLNIGIAEIARSVLQALGRMKHPCHANSVRVSSRRELNTSVAEVTDVHDYSINVVCFGPDNSGALIQQQVGPDYFCDKINVAVWAWELPKLPDKWRYCAKYFEEIWTISDFVRDAVRSSLSFAMPVHTINLALPERTPLERTRAAQIVKQSLNIEALSPNDFVCLFIFDFGSSVYRKNPQDVVRTFSCLRSEPAARLILKSNHADQSAAEFQALQRLCSQHANVHLVDQQVDDETLTALYSLCDVYISLHRAEGCGLTMQNAMMFGKAVICTGYSGNLDFAKSHHAMLVPVREMVDLPQECLIYHHIHEAAGQWASPDIVCAQNHLRLLYTDRDYRLRLGEAARRYLSNTINAQTLGLQILKRTVRYARKAPALRIAILCHVGSDMDSFEHVILPSARRVCELNPSSCTLLVSVVDGAAESSRLRLLWPDIEVVAVPPSCRHMQGLLRLLLHLDQRCDVLLVAPAGLQPWDVPLFQQITNVNRMPEVWQMFASCPSIGLVAACDSLAPLSDCQPELRQLAAAFLTAPENLFEEEDANFFARQSFDATVYTRLYPDTRGLAAERARQHWIEHGSQQRRVCSQDALDRLGSRKCPRVLQTQAFWIRAHLLCDFVRARSGDWASFTQHFAFDNDKFTSAWHRLLSLLVLHRNHCQVELSE